MGGIGTSVICNLGDGLPDRRHISNTVYGIPSVLDIRGIDIRSKDAPPERASCGMHGLLRRVKMCAIWGNPMRDSLSWS